MTCFNLRVSGGRRGGRRSRHGGQAAGEVAPPYQIGSRGVVIVSAISDPDVSGPEIAWQRAGPGTATASSKCGMPGGAATLGGGFGVREGETAILSGVFYELQPLRTPDLIAAKRSSTPPPTSGPRLTTPDAIAPE